MDLIIVKENQDAWPGISHTTHRALVGGNVHKKGLTLYLKSFRNTFSVNIRSDYPACLDYQPK